MWVNGDAISQGIVLASILAGFAFAIGIEIAMKSERDADGEKNIHLEIIAYELFLVGIACIASVAIGITYFLNEDDVSDQSLLSTSFFWALGISITGFVVAMMWILFYSFQRKGFSIALAVLLGVAILVVTLLILSTWN